MSLLLAAGAERARAQSIPAGPGGLLSSVVGSAFDVPLVVDMSARTERLGSFSARVAWSPAVLRLDALSTGTFGAVTTNADSTDQGVLRLAGANPSGASGQVILVSARFTPLVADTTTLRFSLTQLYAALTYADLLPSASLRNGAYCPARGRYGDINASGSANSADALIAVTYAVGLPVGSVDITLGDVDGNGVTNTRDALGILSYAVGLPTSVFRVFQVAPGSCTTAPFTTLAVLPGTVGTVLAGQVVRFEARASDSAGSPQVVVNVRWRSTNTSVATVDSLGRATAVAAGTTTIRAVRDGVDSAQTTLAVGTRHVHYVSAAAVDASNQLGTSALPFADLTEAAIAAARFDTVVVGPGRYDSAAFSRAVVILGQTVAGSGATIAGAGGYAGLTLADSGRSEVHNLAIEGFLTALKLGSVDTVIADSLRILLRGGSTTCFNAGVEIQEAWLVVLRRSQLVGDGSSGCADGIRALGNIRTLVVEDAQITDMGGAGIYAGGYGGGVDSLVVRRSEVGHNNYYGIYAYANPYGTGRIPATSSVALAVDGSRLPRNYYEAIYAYDLRSARIAHSVIDMGSNDDALALYGNGTGYVKLLGDSITVDDYDWLDSYGLDSITVDSTRVIGAYYGYLDGVDLVRVTNSSFTEATGGTLLYVYANRLSEATVVLDSVTAVGASSCSQCMDLVDVSGAVSANRVRVDNFDYGINASDSSVTLRNAVFTNGYQGVYAYSYATPRPRLEARHVAMTGVYYGIESYNVVTVVDSATITGTGGEYEAIYSYGGGADTVRASTVTGYEYGIDLEDSLGYAANNTMLRPTYDAFYFSGNGTAGDSAILINNTVTCDSYGAANAGGVDAYYSNHRFEGNTISGCNWGFYISSGDPTLRARVRGNTISLPSVADYSGIWIYGPYRSEIVGNVVTGGSPYADGNIYLYGTYYSHMPFARVDSNTVQGAQVWGIRAEYVDSLQVRGNLVEDVSTPCCYYSNPGGIALYGNSLYQALVTRNTLRRVHGSGISINQLDTATVVVDTNAVSGADTAAVRLTGGTVRLRRNNVRNNTLDGVLVDGVGDFAMSGNAFKGNGRYAVNYTGDAAVNITGNWWGVNGQPPGAPGTDSVSSTLSPDPSPLAAEPANLLPLVLAPIASSLQAPSAQAAPVASGAAMQAARPQRPVRSLRPLRVEPPPWGRQITAVEARALELRAARAAAIVQRRTSLEAARAAARAVGDSVRAVRDAQRAERVRASARSVGP